MDFIAIVWIKVEDIMKEVGSVSLYDSFNDFYFFKKVKRLLIIIDGNFGTVIDKILKVLYCKM